MFTYMLRRSQMKFIHMIRTAKQKWNSLVTRQLRKVGIFKRLNVSFLALLLISALFLTFFSFFQYSREINLNLTRYTSMLVQNTRLKIQDTMEEYENMALNFYNDSRIIRAISENSSLPENRSPGQEQLFQTNTFLIENRLYSLRQNKKHIVNIQFVTPSRQYHMVEDNGFQRGGTIRDLDAFYKSDFYLVPQDKRGYPVWMDDKEQTGIFYKKNRLSMVLQISSPWKLLYMNQIPEIFWVYCFLTLTAVPFPISKLLPETTTREIFS